MNNSGSSNQWCKSQFMEWMLFGSIWSAGMAFMLSAAAVKGLTGTWLKCFCPTVHSHEYLINSR